ncbi:hypothetical protein DUNSADRAFT_11150 [Dunaliella salina]|uniref:tRNA threonylcarbamoyladenosine biosynthesis protein TsaE n=1 Tax=Dunaliella salina TaxID=3046 RepID=A0ABQ7GE09_DUNSA|nr:hypothetical protein DUNSADRAFT_11150 [Dunaliella salina]|eukprot:KAF5832848.1 hypothetical protein DUNSADRAFT_11150 [Dunaliella salina]
MMSFALRACSQARHAASPHQLAPPSSVPCVPPPAACSQPSVHMRTRRRCASSGVKGEKMWSPSPQPMQMPGPHRVPQHCCASSNQTAGTIHGSRLSLVAPSEKALGRLAALLVQLGGLQAGDVYCLHGDVGAGKSVFSRAFIRAAAGDPMLTVPSPTYLLQNLYDEAMLANSRVPIHHFDLYRLPSDAPPTLERLNLQASFCSAVSLVEWAERAQVSMPKEHLAVHISAIPPGTEQEYTLLGPHHSTPPPAGNQSYGQNAHHGGDSQQGCSGQEQAQGISSEEGAEEEGEEQEEEIDSEEDEDEIDPYSDQRWRMVKLEPHGSSWEQRLANVLEGLQDEIVNGRAAGLRLYQSLH